MIEFAIIGAGWRAKAFLKIAALHQEIRVVGMVVRNKDVAEETSKTWGVACFSSLDELLGETDPHFVVGCVTSQAMPAICNDLAKRGVPILMETPAVSDLNSLRKFYDDLSALDAKVQVAEQFWLQPLHAARLEVLKSGKLGDIQQAHVSLAHDYHAMSLLRKYLGLGFEDAEIVGCSWQGAIIAGPDRSGLPSQEEQVAVRTDHAILDFNGKVGVYDFCQPQYRSWIRGQRVCIRGLRGEIIDTSLTYLLDAQTPIKTEFLRHEGGRNGNHEGLVLKAIQCGEEWVYRNSNGLELTDEELAIEQCLIGMHNYLKNGVPFYGLEEACQDQYLALCVKQAIETKRVVRTKKQQWT